MSPPTLVLLDLEILCTILSFLVPRQLARSELTCKILKRAGLHMPSTYWKKQVADLDRALVMLPSSISWRRLYLIVAEKEHMQESETEHMARLQASGFCLCCTLEWHGGSLSLMLALKDAQEASCHDPAVIAADPAVVDGWKAEFSWAGHSSLAPLMNLGMELEWSCPGTEEWESRSGIPFRAEDVRTFERMVARGWLGQRGLETGLRYGELAFDCSPYEADLPLRVSSMWLWHSTTKQICPLPLPADDAPICCDATECLSHWADAAEAHSSARGCRAPTQSLRMASPSADR